MVPFEWRVEHNLFPHQVGFTCAPFDFDAAPSDFLRMAPDTVGFTDGCCKCRTTPMDWTSGGRTSA